MDIVPGVSLVQTAVILIVRGLLPVTSAGFLVMLHLTVTGLQTDKLAESVFQCLSSAAV